ncbi:hypothetical protein BCR41DRAFT_359597, partial [Lobosporangium transversale]
LFLKVHLQVHLLNFTFLSLVGRIVLSTMIEILPSDKPTVMHFGEREGILVIVIALCL